MDVSLSEWLSLIDALDRGLCGSSITGFYYVSRMILLKSENEFDKYDLLFDEYFKGVHADIDDISDQMKKWLDKSDFVEATKVTKPGEQIKDCRIEVYKMG